MIENRISEIVGLETVHCLCEEEGGGWREASLGLQLLISRLVPNNQG